MSTNIQATVLTNASFSAYENSNSGAVSGVAASDDGTKMYVSIQAGTGYGVMKSVDQGATWTVVNSGNFSSIACSRDGTIVYAVSLGDNIYKSIDSGATWNAILDPNQTYDNGAYYFPGGAANPENSLPGYKLTNAFQIACDGTGTKLIMTTNGAASIYTSLDGGNSSTWIFSYAIPNYVTPQGPVPVTSNIDASVLYFSATQTDTLLYKSINGGTVWTAITSQGAIAGPFPYIASNLTGDVLFAVNVNFNIFYETHAANGVVAATNGSNVTACGSYTNGNKAIIMVNNYQSLTGGVVLTYSISNLYPPGPVPGDPVPVTCFKENSKILCLVDGQEKYVPVQNLKKGTLVKTFTGVHKKVEMLGKTQISHTVHTERIKDQLYKLTPQKYPALFEDLVITGCHSTLAWDFKEGEREKTVKTLGRIFLTEGHYRLPACVDERAKPYENEGQHNIYHFALENDDIYMNYGVFANGLLVETCSKRFLSEYSGMQLIK